MSNISHPYVGATRCSNAFYRNSFETSTTIVNNEQYYRDAGWLACMGCAWSRHQLTACLSSWPPANLNLEPTVWSSSTACAALTTQHTRTFHHFHFQFVFSFSARTLARTVRFGLVRYVAIRFGLVQSTFPSCCGVCWKSSLKASVGSIAQSPNSGIEAVFI